MRGRADCPAEEPLLVSVQSSGPVAGVPCCAANSRAWIAPTREAIHHSERPTADAGANARSRPDPTQWESSASRPMTMSAGRGDPCDPALHDLHNPARRASWLGRAELCTSVMQITTRLTRRGPNARLYRSPAASRRPAAAQPGRQWASHAPIGTVALPTVHDLMSVLGARPRRNAPGKPNHNKARRLNAYRYWMRADGLSLYVGPIVAALEFATGAEAYVVGKPRAGVLRRGARRSRRDRCGDRDDRGRHRVRHRGAVDVGLATILVQTGKYRERQVRESGVEPDACGRVDRRRAGAARPLAADKCGDGGGAGAGTPPRCRWALERLGSDLQLDRRGLFVHAPGQDRRTVHGCRPPD
jgi:hypothetical protein